MMEQVPATNHSKVSLREQADEAQRELAMRQRVYPGLVKRGKMSPAEQTSELPGSARTEAA